MRLGEKMECYQKEKQIEKLYQKSGSPQLQEYQNELSLKNKENILKDIYSSIYLLEKILYETKPQKAFNGQ